MSDEKQVVIEEVPDDVTEHAIRAGQRIAAFVRDEEVRHAFHEAERKFYHEWLAALTVEVREKAHAKTLALEEIKKQLQRIIDIGKTAEIKLQRAEKKAARK